MKILHVTPAYWPAFEVGGPIQSVHSLSKHLVRLGVEVVVYTTKSGLKNKSYPPKNKEIDLDGVKIFYFSSLGYKHYNLSPGLFWVLMCDTRKFDLIHITSIWDSSVSVAAFWARFYGVPYVISPRGSLMREPLLRKSSLRKKIHLALISKRDLKNAAALHFTAESEKMEYLKMGLPSKRTAVIPNGLDLEDFKAEGEKAEPGVFRLRFGIGSDKKIVLFLSRLNWKKGLDTLIPAFARVARSYPETLLVLAGGDDGGYKVEIEKLIDEYALRGEVIFTGLLIGKDRASAFKASDVFVLPSYSENFGMAVVEAMYYKLPVVITEGVAISEKIREMNAGLVIKKNVDELAEAILRVLKGKIDSKMIARGKIFVEKEYSSLRAARKMLKEYRAIVNEN